MNYSLQRVRSGSIIGAIKKDARGLDYSSYEDYSFLNPKLRLKLQ